jgi:uncharacterized membrane protein
MTAIRKVLPLLLLLLLAVSSTYGATWTTVDVPGSQATEAFRINNAGDVVGAFLDAGNVWHGYLLSGGVFTTIDPPGATLTAASGINDMRQITGYFYESERLSHGFLLDGQNYAVLDFPGAMETLAAGINNAGEIVGEYRDTSNQFHGFTWSTSNFTTIDVPGSPATGLLGLNNHGNLVGVYEDSSFRSHGFVLNVQGALRKFGWKQANGINDYKIIVGAKGSNGIKFNLKTDVLVKIRFPHAVSTDCTGINNKGQMVGDYRDASGGLHGFLRTK